MQKLFGATGIVAVLILGGLLIASKGNLEASSTAINAGIGLGVIFGILGIIGILITLVKRIL